MMHAGKAVRRWTTLGVAILIAACGGGGSSGDVTAGIDRGGIVTATGSITGFGSVHVNGVHYVTTGATITLDDNPGSESDLRVGQVVRIEGRLDQDGLNGTATRVIFDDEVEGPVQSIDLASSRMVVLGRTVQVGTQTSFDDSISPRSLEGVAVGDRMEVSGQVATTGVIEATRIERKTVQSSVEVKGTIGSLDTNARSFALDQLTVSYAGAQLNGFASGQPANGDRVEAFGTVDVNGVLVATRIEKESGGAAGNADEQADYEGLITSFVSATDFSVAGQHVTTTASTAYEGGTASNLALDVPVEVEGRFNASGVIVATKVQFHRRSDTEFSGRVDSVNAAGNSLVVFGVTIRVNSLTRFEDHSGADVQQFSLASIAVGDYVEVDAYNDGSGLLATKLERDDNQGEVQLEGVAQNVAAPNFTVGGVAVTTDGNTEFRDINGVTISAAAFFQAAPGRQVKARGTLVGNVVLATRAELED
ncbi:MAG: hypothetical protein IPF84_04720 [Proteobacteria bacterium]|nr:hypothetical protein [Pseudomonadota bacterium]